MNHQGLLPSGWYRGTIRQSYEEDGLVHLWTIDAGKYKWRNLKRTYPPDEVGERWLQQDMDALGFEYMEDFPKQFIGLEGMFHVERYVDGRVMRNIITEFQKPDHPAEVDVLKPKSDDHFFNTKEERDLPI